jgi:hypothetical protein
LIRASPIALVAFYTVEQRISSSANDGEKLRIFEAFDLNPIALRDVGVKMTPERCN